MGQRNRLVTGESWRTVSLETRLRNLSNACLQVLHPSAVFLWKAPIRLTRRGRPVGLGAICGWGSYPCVLGCY
ncbi:uncharacterized protein K444DRAFT_2074 [Hyaloscypha bicolor E]|uniref:Uncharacterized protein n=1 Tax=Hyaloscypha bicolor E TaxID=1095630 RepID=A0A2J6TVD0_9HELO|nr:uncharacterized protein K444DRAFT_2074 [Hyaloscypha bicolor E]PMD66918.1 hypothetical protein K444DRAFT_2074 [Hyaloscypha bicolor E]